MALAADILQFKENRQRPMCSRRVISDLLKPAVQFSDLDGVKPRSEADPSAGHSVALAPNQRAFVPAISLAQTQRRWPAAFGF